MPSSAGKVQSINYNGARFFLDRCLDVKTIHFNYESQNRENLPPPVVPPSTKRPPVALNSITARQTGKCLDFACLSKYLGRDLRQMDTFRCRTNKDCMSTNEKNKGDENSQMICRKFSSLHSSMLRFCDCQEYMAYNPLSCQCEPAEQCGNNSRVSLDIITFLISSID